MDKKRYFRTIAKEWRKSLDIQGISNELCVKLRECDLYQKSKNVMIFYPMKYEINTLELLGDSKNFYLPKVVGEDILVCPYTEELTVSEFNIKEPCSNPVSPEILDLVIVPALMIDKKNYRLGYGGGFYDRFLSKYPQISTVGLIAKELYVDELPHDDYDIALSKVIINKMYN